MRGERSKDINSGRASRSARFNPLERGKDTKKHKDVNSGRAGIPAQFDPLRAIVMEKLEGGNQPTSRRATRGHQELGKLAEALMKNDQEKALQILDQHLNKYSPQSSRGKLTQKELLARLSKETDRILLENGVLRPSLPDETKRLLDQLKQIKDGPENAQSAGAQYVGLMKDALQKLSPETLADYKARNVEFVAVDGDPRWTPNYEKGGKSVVEIPMGKKPVEVMLRLIEVPLQIEHRRDKRIPSPQRRAQIAARVFKVNEKLGEAYGWDITGYKWAEEYHDLYNEGIREAFKEGSIKADKPKDQLEEIGHSYAERKLIESVTPPPGEPKVFPSFGPAAYFEESQNVSKEGLQKRIKLDPESDEFKALLMKLQTRRDKGKDDTFTATIMPNRDIYVQLYYINNEKKSMHAINVEGSPLTFSGEIKLQGERIQDLKLTFIGDQSGHYRTRDDDNPMEVMNDAVDTIKAKGINTSDVETELSTLDGRNREYYI